MRSIFKFSKRLNISSYRQQPFFVNYKFVVIELSNLMKQITLWPKTAVIENIVPI